MLRENPPEVYVPGDTYRQNAEEIHWSQAEPGTVTLVHRVFGKDRDHTSVYYEGAWGTAEPRAATEAEVARFVNAALEGWNR